MHSFLKVIGLFSIFLGLSCCGEKGSSVDQKGKNKPNRKILPNQMAEASTDYLRLYRDAPIGWQNWGKDVFKEAKKQEKAIFLVVTSGRFLETFTLFDTLHESEKLFQELNENFICCAADTHAYPELANYFHELGQIAGGFSFPAIVWLTGDGDSMAWKSLATENKDEITQQVTSMMKSVIDTWERDFSYAHEYSADNNERIFVKLKLPENQDEVNQNEVSHRLIRQLLSLHDDIDNEIDNLGSLVPYSYLEALHNYKNALAKDIELASRADFVLRDVMPTYLRNALKDPIDKGYFYAKMGSRWDLPNFCKVLESQLQLVNLLSYKSVQSAVPESDELMEGALIQINEVLANEDRTVGAYRLARSIDKSKDYFLWTSEELEELLTEAQFKAVKARSRISDLGNISSISDPLKQYYRLNTLNENTELAQAAREAGQSIPELKRNLRNVWSKLRKAREDRAHSQKNELFTETTAVAAFQAKAAEANLIAFETLTSQKYLQRAEELLGILKERFYDAEKGLYRIKSDNSSVTIPARSSDYLGCIRAFVVHHQLTLNPESLKFAQLLSDEAMRKLKSDEGFLSEVPKEDSTLKIPIYSMSLLFDDSTMGTLPFLIGQFSQLTQNKEQQEMAERHRRLCVSNAQKNPILHTDFIRELPLPGNQIVILTGSRSSSQTQKLAADLRDLSLGSFQFFHLGEDALVETSLEFSNRKRPAILLFKGGELAKQVSSVSELKSILRQSQRN